MVWMQRRIRAAQAFNDKHPDQVEKFNQLTGGVAARGVRAIMSWQKDHGLDGDGKIGPATIQAAEAEGGQEDKEGRRAGRRAGATPPAHEKKAEKPQATISAEPAEEEDGLAGELVAGGNTVSQPHRPKEDEGEESKEGGKWAGEGAEKALEGVAGEGLKGDAVAKGAAAIARLPHVIHLVKEKKYKEAAEYIRDVLEFEDYVEVFKLLAEHISIPLEEIAEAVPLLGKFGKAVEIGAGTVDILLVGYEFQKGALEALAKAHEEGERDNLIYLYSSAWAHSFLYGAGSYSNPGAIDEKQKRAVADGGSEGAATAGGLGEKAPEIGKKLLEHYGSPENVERALVDVLLKRAGIEGVRFHAGKEKKGGGKKEQKEKTTEKPEA
jgi:hypothetical protein